jgi:ribosomal protein L35
LNSRLTKKRRRNLRGTGVLITLEAKRVIKSLCGNSY